MTGVQTCALPIYHKNEKIGSDNKTEKYKLCNIDSDTPGLSYLRGPFLSSEKRITEHQNILKSVEGLVNFRYGNLKNFRLLQNKNYRNNCNEKNVQNEKLKFVEKFENKKIDWNLPQNLKISDEKMKKDFLASRQRTFSVESTDKPNRFSPMNSPKILSSLFKISDYPFFSTSSSTSFSLPSPSPFCLKIELPNVTISSWCNENVIAQDLRLNGAVTIERGNKCIYYLCIYIYFCICICICIYFCFCICIYFFICICIYFYFCNYVFVILSLLLFLL